MQMLRYVVKVSKKMTAGILLRACHVCFITYCKLWHLFFHYKLPLILVCSALYTYISQIHLLSSQKEVNVAVVAVVHLKSHDVLLGRGTGPNEHLGNRLFRSLVKQKKDEYEMLYTTRQDKDQIVLGIIQAISDHGGRFLKKIKKKRVKGKKQKKHRPPREEDDENDYDVYYEVAEEQTAKEKTRQAFQYFSRRRREDGRSAAADAEAQEAQGRMVVTVPTSTLSSTGMVDVEASTIRMPSPSHQIYSAAARSLVEDDLQVRMRTYQLESLFASWQVALADGQRFAGLPQYRLPDSISLHQIVPPNTLLHDGTLQYYLRGSRSYVSSSSSGARSLESSLRLAALGQIRTELPHQDPLLLSLRRGWRPATASATASTPPPPMDWLFQTSTPLFWPPP
jgi:hypothetical protein